MKISINYRGTLFEKADLNPILGESTFKRLHTLWYYLKENEKYVFYNLGGGAHVHIGWILTDSQYALISNTTFVYLTHLNPLIIPYGTTAHMNFNVRVANTEAVRFLYEVTGVEQALVHIIVSTVEEAYLADTRNRTTN